MLIISNERNNAEEEDGMFCHVEMGVAVALFSPIIPFLSKPPNPGIFYSFF